MHSAPKATATTATKGSQVLPRTVRPTERLLAVGRGLLEAMIAIYIAHRIDRSIAGLDRRSIHSKLAGQKFVESRELALLRPGLADPTHRFDRAYLIVLVI